MPRYIDAEKVLNEFRKRYRAAMSWYKNVSGLDLKIRAEQAVVSFLESILTIKNQPSVDVAPVIHARWEAVNGECRCSNCKAMLEEYLSEWVNFDYCYHCGAKMDGKETEQ